MIREVTPDDTESPDSASWTRERRFADPRVVVDLCPDDGCRRCAVPAVVGLLHRLASFGNVEWLRSAPDVDRCARIRHAVLPVGRADVDGVVLDGAFPRDGGARSEPDGEADGAGRPVLVDARALLDPGTRSHFLSVVFARAAFRAVRASRDHRALIEYQTIHKLQLMSCDPHLTRRLGDIVANHRGDSFDVVIARYANGIDGLFGDAPHRGRIVNAAQHAFGYFSERLDAAQRREFLERLDAFQAGATDAGPVTSLLHTWALRFGVRYLVRQSFLQPFPASLGSAEDA